MEYPDSVLLVFAKAPVAGEVNTRLIPDIGAEAASALQAELIHSRLSSFTQANLCELQLWCSPDAEQTFFVECHGQYGVSLHEQSGRDLGERMSHAFDVSLKKFKHVVLIGTDAPALNNDAIMEAFESLHVNDDIVLVPAEDGGYVLIGMNELHKEVFLSVPWGSDRVLKKTRGNIIALGKKANELAECWDVDCLEDYERYQKLK